MITDYDGQSREIAEVFHAAVHQIASSHYTPEQVRAWAPAPIDYDSWRLRCELKRPCLFLEAGRVAGFIEFDSEGHIDGHYVHPARNRNGIGGALLTQVLDLADGLVLPRVYVEASHIARGLYLKHGFQVVAMNVVARHGVTLENWRMERRRDTSALAAKAPR